MNRRDFIRHLALLSAGAAAMPAQVDAFRGLFERNTPHVPSGLVSVQEIMIGGIATTSIPAQALFFRRKPQTHEMIMCCGLNLFGGVLRWVAPVEGPIMAEAIADSPFGFKWEVRGRDGELVSADAMHGCLRYIDQDGRLKMAMLTPQGGLHA